MSVFHNRFRLSSYWESGVVYLRISWNINGKLSDFENISKWKGAIRFYNIFAPFLFNIFKTLKSKLIIIVIEIYRIKNKMVINAFK